MCSTQIDLMDTTEAFGIKTWQRTLVLPLRSLSSGNITLYTCVALVVGPVVHDTAILITSLS